MMKSTIHILHLEDDCHDAELVARAVTADNLDARIDCVETSENFMSALERGGYDVILADYSLPSYDGMSALAAAKKSCPDIPFIFVSGKMGEESVIEALTMGATDYVLKDNLTRLSAALQRAFREREMVSERRRAEVEREEAVEALRESEAKYRQLTEKINDIVWTADLTADLDVRTTYNSPSIEKVLGFSPEERNGMSLGEMVAPASIAEIRDIMVRELALEEQGQAAPDRRIVCDVEFYHKDGSTRWLENVIAGIRNEQGFLTGFHGVSRDVTARRKAVAQREAALDALRLSEERYRNILNSMQESYYEVDLQGNLTFFNLAAMTHLGYPDQDLQGMNFRCFVDERYHENVVNVFSQVLATDTPISGFDWELVTRDGTRVPVEASVSLMRNAAGEPIGFSGVARGTIERKQAEAEREQVFRELEKSRERYRMVVENVNDVIWTFSLDDMCFTYVSPSAERLWGYSAEAGIGLKIEDVFFPETLYRVTQAFEELRTGKLTGDRLIMAAEHKIADGESTWMEINATTMKDDEGKITGFLGVSRDIAERKKAEDSLARTRKSLAEAQRISHVGNWEWTIASDEVYCSDELFRILGVDAGTFGGTLEAFLALMNVDDDREALAALIQDTVEQSGKREAECSIGRHDGSRRYIHQRMEPVIDDRGQVTGVIGTFQDTTDKKQAEEELRHARDQLAQAEKMTSLGRISAGVAHEILNPVGIISLELQVLKSMETLSPQVLEELSICMEQVNRIVAIADNLKQFSRLSKQEMAFTDINNVIEDIVKLFSSQIKIEDVVTDMRLQADLPLILLDRKKMGQVFVNLLSNALAAMEDKENKLLVIQTTRHLVGGNEYVKIAMSDTGRGISARDMNKIFDPFYTNREQGKGTGLGLYISYGIIHDHGGRIWAENNEWGGASFFIDLPVTREVDTKPQEGGSRQS